MAAIQSPTLLFRMTESILDTVNRWYLLALLHSTGQMNSDRNACGITPDEITVTLPPELHEALLKAAELAELTANAHADMLNAHAPAAAEERRELGRTFAAARLRLHNARALAQLRAIVPAGAAIASNA